MPPPGAAVIRHRPVRLDPAALAGVGAGRRVVLDLFDDQSVTGIVSHRDETHRGRFTLSGHVAGEPGGTFVLAVNRDAVAGVVQGMLLLFVLAGDVVVRHRIRIGGPQGPTASQTAPATAGEGA